MAGENRSKLRKAALALLTARVAPRLGVAVIRAGLVPLKNKVLTKNVCRWAWVSFAVNVVESGRGSRKKEQRKATAAAAAPAGLTAAQQDAVDAAIQKAIMQDRMSRQLTPQP